MGLFSFVGGLLGSGSQKKAAKNASAAMVAALQQGIDQQNAFNQQTRADYAPYLQAGTGALGQLTSLQGLNGNDARSQAFSSLVESDPRYATLFDRGQDTILANASANGGLRGGNTQAALAELSPNVLASVYDMVMSGLQGTAGLGLGAQGNVTQAGQGVTNNITNLLGEIGGTKANGFLARGRINSDNWQNAGSFLDKAVSSFLPIGFGGITAAGTEATQGAAQNLIRSRPGIF